MAGRAQRDVLRLSAVSRADCGVYQCLVRRADGQTAQSAAAVRLGGECPFWCPVWCPVWCLSVVRSFTCSLTHATTCVGGREYRSFYKLLL